MDDVETVCPVCHDPIYIPVEEYAELLEGDVLECENCGAYLEILSLDPIELVAVEGGEDGFYVLCPRCEHEIAVEAEGESVTCDNCGYTFTPDWSEVEADEDDERDYRN
ncbi:paraquat-inducible protein A [Meiothermus granaticius]|uniref:Uncharacterized protein n=1 Tax=Meiothermus granaticius NBRC 107808 TaxID=1227551 RepID=A0A399FEM7_9DEIN|nr:paraquat-inducible protein A [Meiothermus granaticius]MCL6528269.1 paraquat-inducible protein A [Thermaceae bacterium]RIH93582.1 hypothetical protein Mgrana_00406 [Meiothermus granaticius NBRC 107808]GEM87220.1 hypothetical protein MGR01S_18450 [Meiothermus granaticius NBRC 107808]